MGRSDVQGLGQMAVSGGLTGAILGIVDASNAAGSGDWHEAAFEAVKGLVPLATMAITLFVPPPWGIVAATAVGVLGGLMPPPPAEPDAQTRFVLDAMKEQFDAVMEKLDELSDSVDTGFASVHAKLDQIKEMLEALGPERELHVRYTRFMENLNAERMAEMKQDLQGIYAEFHLERYPDGALGPNTLKRRLREMLQGENTFCKAAAHFNKVVALRQALTTLLKAENTYLNRGYTTDFDVELLEDVHEFERIADSMEVGGLSWDEPILFPNLLWKLARTLPEDQCRERCVGLYCEHGERRWAGSRCECVCHDHWRTEYEQPGLQGLGQGDLRFINAGLMDVQCTVSDIFCPNVNDYRALKLLGRGRNDRALGLEKGYDRIGCKRNYFNAFDSRPPCPETAFVFPQDEGHFVWQSVEPVGDNTGVCFRPAHAPHSGFLSANAGGGELSLDSSARECNGDVTWKLTPNVDRPGWVTIKHTKTNLFVEIKDDSWGYAYYWPGVGRPWKWEVKAEGGQPCLPRIANPSGELYHVGRVAQPRLRMRFQVVGPLPRLESRARPEPPATVEPTTTATATADATTEGAGNDAAAEGAGANSTTTVATTTEGADANYTKSLQISACAGVHGVAIAASALALLGHC